MVREQGDDSPPGDDAARYARDGAKAMIPGDRWAGRTVVGFAYVGRESVPPSAADDQVVLDGEEHGDAPPLRAVPGPETEFERCGELPPNRMPPGLIHDVSAVPSHMAVSIGALADGAPDPAGAFFTGLFRRVAELGHLVWVVGGSVRDLLAEGPSAGVKDLDLSGTVPPGLMATLAWESLTDIDLSDISPHVSQGRVCSVRLTRKSPPLMEYRALTVKGHAFPLSGGDLVRDAWTRDLTINSVHYDPRRGLLLDPTERGLTDLNGPKRILYTEYRYDDPVEQAMLLLRLVKFVARWRAKGCEVDARQPAEWAAELPPDLFKAIPRRRWRGLAKSRLSYLADHPEHVQEAAAREIGPMAVRLLTEIDERSPR